MRFFSVRQLIFLAALLSFAIEGFAIERTCGTWRALQNIQELRSTSYSARTATSARDCDDSDYYSEVLQKKTTHFQIFYTLEGPHKTTAPFVDTLSLYLEKAWNAYVEQMKFKTPVGRDTSHHFQQKVEGGLYPVEVIDIDLVRDPIAVLGSASGCNGCMGVTFSGRPDNSTQLFIDNDFYATAGVRDPKETYSKDGKSCTYSKATLAIENVQHDYTYTKNWAKGIKVTTFHEFYHAIQLQYLPLSKRNFTFWYESSAAGIEEVMTPEIDDYIRYILYPASFAGKPFDQITDDYGGSVLFLYLYNHIDKRFDKSIWETFAKKDDMDFKDNLQNYLKGNGLEGDSVFHDFAIKLSFSGPRANALDSAKWINPDEFLWPKFSYSYDVSFIPDTTDFTYYFHSGSIPDISNFSGKTSAILYKNNRAKVFSIHSIKAIDSIAVQSNLADSTIWVMSRLGESSPIPNKKDDISLRAFPTPWRSGSPLCFSPLPQNKEFIEIRNRRGDLIFREPYQEETHCIDEATIKEKLAPGVYRYRAGTNGKTKDFIIIY